MWIWNIIIGILRFPVSVIETGLTARIWILSVVKRILRFPGFVMETVARKLSCDLLGVPVYKAEYFEGMIIHGRIDSPARAALIAFAPFFVNTALCAILFFPVAFAWLLGSSSATKLETAVQYLLAWVGISMGMTALPTSAVANAYLEDLPEHMQRRWIYAILREIGMFFVVIDFLKRFWLDLVFALFIGVVTPQLVARLFIAP